jgi:hypothetical protein
LGENALDPVGGNGSLGARTYELTWWLMGQEEEGCTHGMVPSPATSDVEGASTGDDRSAVEHLLDDRAAPLGRPESVVSAQLLVPGSPPIEESTAAITERIVGTVIRPSDEPVE